MYVYRISNISMSDMVGDFFFPPLFPFGQSQSPKGNWPNIKARYLLPPLCDINVTVYIVR